MKDLLDAVIVKKQELETLVNEKFNIKISNDLVNDKIIEMLPKSTKEKNIKILRKDNRT